MTSKHSTRQHRNIEAEKNKIKKSQITARIHKKMSNIQLYT